MDTQERSEGRSQTADNSTVARPGGGRLVLLIAGGAVLAAMFFFGLRHLVNAFTHESSDDAFIEASIVGVAPKVAGLVSAVHVRDNQIVKKGDPLVDIDPRDYETTLTRKQAALQVAEGSRKTTLAAFELMTVRVATAQAAAKQAQAQAAASQATAERAEADFKRAEALLKQGILSQQEYDQARATAIAARANADADRENAASSESKVTEARAQLNAVVAALDMVAAQINQARADATSGELDLSYTRILAPVDGKVTRKAVQPGEYVQVGQWLLALVPTDVWVIANFKETQLTHMRPGQPVEIHVDAYPDQKFAGHVDSIQAGSGARFSLLPPENAVGNYVKVVQRVPVKILFETPPDTGRALGPGMSVVPSVRISSFTVSPVLLWAGALVLAVLATLGLARVIDHLRD
jgi:membrane fusion protein, multidrug efflux system